MRADDNPLLLGLAVAISSNGLDLFGVRFADGRNVVCLDGLGQDDVVLVVAVAIAIGIILAVFGILDDFGLIDLLLIFLFFLALLVLAF